MYRLHSFCQSGNAYKVAFFLQTLGLEVGARVCGLHERSHPHGRLARAGQPHGRGPCAGGWRAQPHPVWRDPHLSGPKARPAYLGKTEDDKLEVLRWVLFDNHKFTGYFAPYRFMKSFGPTAPDAAVMGWLKGRMDNAFGIVNKHLAHRAFMVGDQPTIARLFSVRLHVLPAGRKRL